MDSHRSTKFFEGVIENAQTADSFTIENAQTADSFTIEDAQTADSFFTRPFISKKIGLPILGFFSVCFLLFQSDARAETEEQRLVRIAQLLKPISNSQWHEILGAKISDTYDVQKGDTLWDISKRLFGNAFYWPKVWSLNNRISNPHILSPGQKLAFVAGSSDAIPKLIPSNDTGAMANAASTTATATSIEGASNAGPSGQSGNEGTKEYEKISPEMWAPQDPTKKLRSNYDSFGIDKELKVSIPSRFTFRVPAIANDTTVPFLAEIVASRRNGVGLSQSETVFLKSPAQDLQVGTSYTILGDGDFVREKKSDRSGYIYHSIGEIKVVGVKDELYVGQIENAYDVVKRGDKLYPLLPLVNDIKPVAARTALEALVVFSTEKDAHNSSQFRFIHLDRGIEDGVQIGNVFRIYDYYDPATKNKITDSDFLINADAIVVHATAQFSTALVLRSRDTIGRGDFGVLLTDVSDLDRRMRDGSHNFGEGESKNVEDKELDELDALDKESGEGIGKKEETEIKELDQWDKSKDLQHHEGEAPTVPSAADTPSDEIEKHPGSTPPPSEEPTLPNEPSATSEPTLDQTLDAPRVTPKGIEPPAPPPEVKAKPDQTLDAPTSLPQAPNEEGEVVPNLNTPTQAPTLPVEPMVPQEPDDVELKPID